jgi:hydrogenase-4 component E
MTPTQSELASQWITLLAAGMLVLQLLMVVQRMLLTSIRLFALQSLMLAAIATIIAYFHDAREVYVVAFLTLVGKVWFLPLLLNRLVRRIVDAALWRFDVAGLRCGSSLHLARTPR